MRAVILAAGQGSRLRPLTDDRPKCLVELGGVALLDRQTAALRACGIHDITVVAGYRAETISALGYRTVVNTNYAHTNMVATLFCAGFLFDGSDDVLVSYGDIVYEPRVVQDMLACPDEVSVGVDRAWRRYWELRTADPLTDAETLKLEHGLIRELGKKPRDFSEVQGQYMGLILVRASAAPRLADAYRRMDRARPYDGKDFDNMYMTSFLQYLIDTGWAIQAVQVESGWLEVDTPADLDLYHRLWNEGRLGRYYRLDEGSP